MNLYRLLTTAAAVALFTGAANAQTSAGTPAAAEPAPAAVQAPAAADCSASLAGCSCMRLRWRQYRATNSAMR